ncbi:hypothetical protein GH733_015300 [Mirounga leonina]|nr:hypothetical protein GH733_015300 [Mirounga leonina]
MKSQEGLRNFKELRAKFQKLDVPSLPGPIKFSAGVPQKGDIGNTQSRILANGKPLSSNQNPLPPCCSSAEPQLLKPQETKLTQRGEIQKCSNSPGPPERSPGSAVNSQKTSLLLDMSPLNAEITNKRRVMVKESFKDKLWNWEKVSSQKSELSSASLLASCARRAFHPEEQISRGLPPKEPRRKLEIKGPQTLPSQRHLMAQRESLASPEDPTFLLVQHGRKSLENPLPERSPGRGSCQPIYESELASQAPEKQPVDRHHQLLKTKPLPSIKSLGLPPPKPPKPPFVNLQAFQRQAAAISKVHREGKKTHRAPHTASQQESRFQHPCPLCYLPLRVNSQLIWPRPPSTNPSPPRSHFLSTKMNQEKLARLQAQVHIGTTIPFHKPEVQASGAATALSITGHAEEAADRKATSVLNQLVEDELAEALPTQCVDGNAPLATREEEEEEEVPDLVENFDEASKNKAN